MSKKNKYPHLTDDKAEYAEKAVQKMSVVRAVKKLSNENSQWTLTQEILQEIIASHVVANPDKLPKIPQLMGELKKEIEARYDDDKELKELLLESVPAARSIREWVKKEGWEDAIWDKIRRTGLFTSEKRAEMINALFTRGARGKDTQAAKIWLTLSGDYVEKIEANDKTADTYREINKILHKKNND